MGLIEKRDYIYSHLHQIDENALNEIYRVIESKIGNQEDVVGYEADGTPMMKAQFIKSIKEAEDQIDRGKFITLEDLEKESENW